MKFVFYSSLKNGAKKAFNKGNGNYRKYVIDSGCIACKNEDGTIKEFIKVIKTKGKIIKGKV